MRRAATYAERTDVAKPGTNTTVRAIPRFRKSAANGPAASAVWTTC